MQPSEAAQLHATMGDTANPTNFLVISHSGGWQAVLDAVEDKLDDGFSPLISLVERYALNSMARCQRLDSWQRDTLCSIALRLGIKSTDEQKEALKPPIPSWDWKRRAARLIGDQCRELTSDEHVFLERRIFKSKRGWLMPEEHAELALIESRFGYASH